ncbi:MAG: ABC transporter substrate-binding protein [Proteobacteria bacterium]|nr:ABC transporter substrate-binding protein [Pseudomonadota bacterium]
MLGGVLAAAVALSCATPGPDRAATEAELAAYAAANGLLERDPSAAARQFQDFLRVFPDSPLADDVAEQLGKLAAAQGDAGEAARWFAFVLRNHPNGDRADAVRLQLAQLERRRGRAAAAARVLKGLRLDRLSQAERLIAQRLKADLARDPVERLQWLARVRAETADEDALALLDVEIDEIVSRLEDDDLERAFGELDGNPPAARVALRRAERALQQGEPGTVSRWLDRARRAELGAREARRLEDLRLRLALEERIADDGDLLPTFAELAELPPPRTDGATGTVGVVLPLSGPFAEFGEESLNGILLAARVFEERDATASENGVPAVSARSGAPTSVRVVVRDSRGRPDRAAEAVRDLARDENLVAIIGPLLSGECEAAAQAAEEAGVPLLALTARGSVASERANVFRLRTTPSDEVSLLAAHAIEELGAERFAILYPEDGYGRGMRKQFWEAISARGGVIVASSGYDPKATDYAGPIREMIGFTLLTEEEEEALKERARMLKQARRLPPEEAAVAREEAEAMVGPDGDPLPPIVDFDALFVPDGHDKVAQIAPQLAFHQVTGVHLLGSGAWNHPELVRIERRYIDGARISAPFHRESAFPFVADFVARYTTVYGQAPDSFAAEAFDATNLVLVQLAVDRDTRGAVRDGVLRTQAYPGVSGVTSILPDGNARKRPFLLGIQRGGLVPLD